MQYRIDLLCTVRYYEHHKKYGIPHLIDLQERHFNLKQEQRVGKQQAISGRISLSAAAILNANCLRVSYSSSNSINTEAANRPAPAAIKGGNDFRFNKIQIANAVSIILIPPSSAAAFF